MKTILLFDFISCFESFALTVHSVGYNYVNLAINIAIRNNFSLIKDLPCTLDIWMVSYSNEIVDGIRVTHYAIIFDEVRKTPKVETQDVDTNLNELFDFWAYLRYRDLQVICIADVFYSEDQNSK